MEKRLKFHQPIFTNTSPSGNPFFTKNSEEPVFNMIFPPDHESAEVVEPSKEAFHFPSLLVSAQFSTVLSSRSFSTSSMGTNQLNVLVVKLLAKRVRIVGSVSDQLGLQGYWNDDRFESLLNKLHFSRVSACCANGDWKTMRVCHRHDLGPYTVLCRPDTGALSFLAEQRFRL